MNTSKYSKRHGAGIAAIFAASLLSGCMGPTYGTGTPADEQLLNDVTSILSLAPDRKEPIVYKPRPELVTPATTTALPPPQDSVASASNPNWPESPEATRARIRAEATANRDNPGFEPGIEYDMAVANPADSMTPQEQRVEFKRRLAMSKQGSATQRRYLSEPPIEYRQPAATAPTGEIGEDERDKEKRLKAEARKKAGKTSWADMLPW